MHHTIFILQYFVHFTICSCLNEQSFWTTVHTVNSNSVSTTQAMLPLLRQAMAMAKQSGELTTSAAVLNLSAVIGCTQNTNHLPHGVPYRLSKVFNNVDYLCILSYHSNVCWKALKIETVVLVNWKCNCALAALVVSFIWMLYEFIPKWSSSVIAGEVTSKSCVCMLAL